jgi:hypothetical protein
VKTRNAFVLFVVLGMMLGVATAVYAQNPISPGDTVEGQLNGSTAQYSFTSKAGETVIISLNSDAFDPLVILYDASGNEVGRDDDSGGFLNSRLAFTAPSDGTYTITVTDLGSPGTGAYTLNLATQTANPITYGAPVETTMAGTSPLYFSFEGTEGDVLNIYADSATDEDTRLVLRGPDNTEIVSDDDSGGDLNPYIRRVILLSTGTYQVELAPYSDVALSGDITLTVEQTELLALDANPQTVTIGGDNPDSEVFQFEGTAGVTYRVRVALGTSESTSSINVSISQAGELFPSISLNSFGVSGATMDFTPETTGTLIVEVSGSIFSETSVDMTVSVEVAE